MFRVKKKNLIALALVTVLLASGIGVYQVKAAVKVNTNANCSLTVVIPDVGVNPPAAGKVAGGITNYDGTDQLTIKLYKIADVTEAGTFTSKFEQLKVFDDGKVDSAEAKTLADEAYKLVGPSADVEFKMSPSAGSYQQKDIPVGVYLYVPSIPDTDRYSFEFTKGVISLPTSDYIQGRTIVAENGALYKTTSNSDEWKYEAKIALKSEATQKWGKLKVEKNLSTYNQSLGTASFIYEIEAKYGNDVVYSNVVSIDLQNAGEGYSEELTIPAGTTVTVTEVNTGASYKLEASAIVDKDSKPVEKIIAGETVVAQFTNDYDGELQVGGISVVNRYTKIDGNFSFEGKNVPGINDQQIVVEPVEEVAR